MNLAEPIRSWMPPVLYVGYMDGLPEILLARWPAVLRQPDTFKTWICETPDELAQVQSRLDQPVPITGGRMDFTKGPDGALGPARGAKPRGRLMIVRYPPPEPGWPWLVLVSLDAPQPGFARDRYAWEAFDSELEALAYMTMLGSHGNAEFMGLPPRS